jgi:hypothetical protein
VSGEGTMGLDELLENVATLLFAIVILLVA